VVIVRWWLVRGEEALPAGTDWLAPGELTRLRGLGYPKRRTEYLLRRLVAKHAVALATGWPLTESVLAAIEVANAPSGAPYVRVGGAPAGVGLSISDRAGWAVCVLGPGLGCDLELVEPRSAAFVRDYLTAVEQAYVRGRPPGPARDLAANLLWSGKESALKVGRTGLRRDTREIEVRPDPPGPDGWGTLAIHDLAGVDLTGYWRCEGQFVFTVATTGPGLPPLALTAGPALAAALPRHSWLDRN
jgi:4'-phosphopantetheinyl transferase